MSSMNNPTTHLNPARVLTAGRCGCGCGFAGQQWLLPSEAFQCADARDAAHRAAHGWTPENSVD